MGWGSLEIRHVFSESITTIITFDGRDKWMTPIYNVTLGPLRALPSNTPTERRTGGS